MRKVSPYNLDIARNTKVALGDRPTVAQSTSAKAQQAALAFRQRARKAREEMRGNNNAKPC